MAVEPRTALVLSGGGARGAYQAGVLRGIADLVGPRTPPFHSFVGTSAGAINAAVLASHADGLGLGIDTLCRVWGTIEPSMVFRTDIRSIGGIGARWIRDLSFGGLTRKIAPKSLLDSAPLRGLLTRVIDPDRITTNIANGSLHSLLVSAIDLYSANGVAFLQADARVPLWSRPRWVVERTRITVEHVLASSAIPIFFPSVSLDGRWFGDGSLRNTNPLSPAIHLGADRVVAIGVRDARAAPEIRLPPGTPAPSIAEVAGVLLDAVMLDAVEVDVAQASQVNRSVLSCATDDPSFPFRQVDVLWISPSVSLADIAGEMADRIPGVVRYLLRGLGTDAATTELTSFLLFDSAYCSRLIEIGRSDVSSRADEVLDFFSAPRSAVAAIERA